LVETHIVSDQMGRRVEVPKFPERIISLVPSQSELLYDFGLGDRVVGVTKFCGHPKAWLKTKAIIGGTKKFNFELIDELQPDLIIGNKEENYLEGISELEKKYPVWMSDINTIDEALEMIISIGAITGLNAQATGMKSRIITEHVASTRIDAKSAIYLIWKKPYMAVGQDTFINEMMGMAGFRNMINGLRYPEVSLNEIQSLSPEYVLLSSEPYPFQKKHIAEIEAILPDSKVVLVDGEIFSWYGSRMLKANDYFKSMQR